jgi:hypothetical protein
MHYVIGIVSLFFWILSIKGGLKAYNDKDYDRMYRAEWFSIAYLAIAAWCFH